MGEDTSLTQEQRLLIEQHVQHATLVARRMERRVPYDFAAECEGVALEGLVKAARSFDKRMGTPFPVYASTVIRRFIIDTCRKETWDYNRNKKERAHRASPNTLQKVASPTTTPTPKNVVEQMLDRARDVLSGRDERIIREYLKGSTLKEIGKEEGLTGGRVQQILTNIRGRLRKHLEQEGIRSSEDLFPTFP